ncbi:hypothetical protein Bca52824_029876 [Brassica carinata]|uniref:Receptor-like serine/threonine-protein kinase n=1 Tax=Brassica carinata TaxID=52824 RepID=A0A8X7S9H3_BRACI|nr:hypothetical protein Bca52824_029876 [Brassica carinata]
MGFLSCSILLLVLVLQLQVLVVLSQNIINGYVPVGESLTASDSQQISSSWLSPSGDFALGFRKIQPNDGFTLSIWFAKIPNTTIVWHAQDVNTTSGLVPAGSKVTLTADRGMVLTNLQGKQLWSSSLNPSNGSVYQGRMTDAGNFRLLSKDSSTDFWSSFDNPTDTLLPTQSLDVGRNLSSRRTETGFRKGKFRLQLGPDGNLQLLVLNSNSLSDSDVYFQYYESNTKGPNPGTSLVFNQSGYMYVLLSDNSTLTLNDNKEAPASSTDYYHLAVLHFDGVLAQYYHPKENMERGWRLAWSKPDNICGSSNPGAVGNVACGRPRCECPERFMLKDPSNAYGDCVPSFEMQACQQENNETNVDANVYELFRLDRVNWPYGDYEKYNSYNEESCKAACLNDCFCAAVVFGADQICWKKKYPLSYGHRAATISSDTLIKVLKRSQLKTDVPVTAKRGQDRDWFIKLIIACSVLLGTSAFANLMLLALYRKRSKSKKTNKARDISAANAFELNLRVFTYKELAEATGTFIEELGRGAYGIVYKGVLKVVGDSQVTVAVKKLDRVVQDNEKEFKNEVRAIGQTYHKNLVRLIGFCNEGQSRLIVYEPNWKDRRRIAVEIARGILYLHEECCEQIIHCDIKPQNILLDESYCPRISDFGLAKLLRMNQTNTLTNIRGTKGYVATEWFRNNPITSKVDVYSYGVVLLEIVCCKKAVDLEDNVILIDWAYDCFRNRRLDDLMEDDLEAMEDMEMVERYVKIGIWCVAQVHDPPNPSPYSIFSCEEYLSCGPVSRV